MRSWVLAVVAAIFGSAVGGGIAWSDFATIPTTYPGAGRAPTVGAGAHVSTSAEGTPVVEVEGAEKREESYVYDFGTTERGTTGQHTFVFRNIGTAPLTLEKGEFTCSCTVADMENNAIPPGESVEVVLKWTPKEYTSHFSHGGEIRTNDPSRRVVRLQIVGRVTQAVRAVPEDFVFDHVSANQAYTSTMTIYDYRGDSLEVTGHEFEKADTAKFFDVEVVPLSEQAVAEERGAQGGVEVRLTLKPGLPLGPINQKIRLKLNRENPSEIEADIRGQVVGDITFIGPGFNADRSVLKIGSVARDEGASRKMHVIIKGPYRQDVQLKIARVEPKGALQAELGEPRAVNDGAVIMVPLEVTVPPGAPLGDYLGTRPGEIGRIVLETTHPDAKEARLYVSFLVEKSD